MCCMIVGCNNLTSFNSDSALTHSLTLSLSPSRSVSLVLFCAGTEKKSKQHLGLSLSGVNLGVVCGNWRLCLPARRWCCCCSGRYCVVFCFVLFGLGYCSFFSSLPRSLSDCFCLSFCFMTGTSKRHKSIHCDHWEREAKLVFWQYEQILLESFIIFFGFILKAKFNLLW